MVEIIIANGDLLDGDMPIEFLNLVAHVSGYEVVLARWDENDFSEHIAPTNFPENLRAVVKAEYDRLRLIQERLLTGRFGTRH